MPSPLSHISQIFIDLRAKGLAHPHERPEGQRSRVLLADSKLDAFLGGGLPCGGITEIFGCVSSGRTTLAQMLISAATRAGELAAWIDLPNAFDPNGADTAGVDLGRMLWVFPSNRIAAVRVAEQVLDVGGFRVVVLDLNTPSVERLTVPSSAWLRISRVAARRDAAIVVLTATNSVGAFATMSLEVRAGRRVFAGNRGPCPIFAEATSALRVQRCRFGISGEVAFELVASPSA